MMRGVRNLAERPIPPGRAAPLAAFVTLVIAAGAVIAFTLAQPGQRPHPPEPPAPSSPPATPRADPGPQATSPVTEALPPTSNTAGAANGARHAAVAFVSSYRAYQERRIPASAIRDADPRIEPYLRLVPRVVVAHGPPAVGLAAGAPGSYLADSSIGHFTLVRRRRRWLVTSLPGD